MSDSNEFFSTPEVSAHLDLVRHLIENSELVPLVRGPAGIGKSLLAARLQQAAPENWVVCHFSAEPALQPERLLAYIARCSGLPDIAGNLMQRLSDRFEVLRKRGRVPVLLIDDAQMLPPTSLMTLLRLFERQVEGARLVSIVLFADEQIDLLLSTPQLQVMTPQAIQAIDMPALTRQEATGFMHYILNSEGLSDEFSLDETKLGRLHKETGGVPGRLATEILNEIGQLGSSSQPFLTGYRKKLVLIGAPLLSVILLLLLFQGPINALFAPSEVESESLSSVAEPESSQIVLPSPEEAATANEAQKPQDTSLTLEADPVDISPISEVDADLLPSVGESPVTQVDVKTSAVVETPVQEPVIDPVPIEQSLSEDQTHQAIDIPEAVKELPEVVAEVVPKSEEVATVEAPVAEAVNEDISETTETPAKAADAVSGDSTVSTETAGSVTEAEKPEIAAETAPQKESVTTDNLAEAATDPIPTPTKAVQKDGVSQAREWVLEQPPKNYTLQLIAVENITSLQRFIKKNGLDNQVFTVKTQRRGSPWYALVWGSFESREQALKAQTQLPPAIQKAGVWARTFASLTAIPGG
ncbi:MAG: AAA family ATPase [Candidatus Thiodiazotropha sp. LLP2]